MSTHLFAKELIWIHNSLNRKFSPSTLLWVAFTVANPQRPCIYPLWFGRNACEQIFTFLIIMKCIYIASVSTRLAGPVMRSQLFEGIRHAHAKAKYAVSTYEFCRSCRELTGISWELPWLGLWQFPHKVLWAQGDLF